MPKSWWEKKKVKRTSKVGRIKFGSSPFASEMPVNTNHVLKLIYLKHNMHRFIASHCLFKFLQHNRSLTYSSQTMLQQSRNLIFNTIATFFPWHKETQIKVYCTPLKVRRGRFMGIFIVFNAFVLKLMSINVNWVIFYLKSCSWISSRRPPQN